jgi:hypothetical protein
MSRMRNLIARRGDVHAARVTSRALDRALSRAVTPESRHELIVLGATRR